MKLNGVLFIVALLASVGGVAPAEAHLAILTPTQAVVLPADDTGQTKVAVVFDLSGLRSGAGRRIDEALLEWSVSGVPDDRISEYAAYGLTSSWTESSVQTTAPAVAERASARWSFGPLDYERNGGGRIRLEVTELASGWVGGVVQNYGILITTPDLSRTNAEAQVGNIRLTIRYGFMAP